jgi:putative sigma-54 modulation protein
MKIIITAKGKFTVPEAVAERLRKKLSKLDKFFSKDTEAYAVLSQAKGIEARVEVTITHGGMIYRALGKTDDMYASVDAVAALLERQIRENKSRLVKRLQKDAFIETPEDEPVAEKQFDIIRTKRFQVKPMDIEEAILQMNMLGHSFFVFRSMETDEVNVIYKRDDGGYGLITPTE